jgi:hypothetical protein
MFFRREVRIQTAANLSLDTANFDNDKFAEEEE